MLRAILFDLGDTIMQEVTEEKDETRTTQRADLFPGMAEALRTLRARGYPLGLVADTRPGTYRNVLRQHGLFELFSAFAISEELGVSKPDPLMFRHALAALGVPEADAGRVVMVGNNLARDIRGANGLGLISVCIRWNDRYPAVPAGPEEAPRHTVRSAEELLRLVEALELGARG
jgi:HAD superfamily hydrolase (TIGR01549 family)